jgi:aspartokinase/homoserine dehydrogenase 1|tara:strand:- start:1271 stop:3724 length:2454 start_codon:yes stop_codon:yes gene_type:complete
MKGERREMKVLKFGGSSISTPDRIEAVLNVIQSVAQYGEARAVVVSAFGGVTDQLIEMSSSAEMDQGGYKVSFNDLKERHFTVVRELIAEEHRSRTESILNDLFTELEELLRGISMVKEVSLRTKDTVLSFGERLSATIITACLRCRGTDADFLDVREVIKTDRTFGSAQVNMPLTLEKIREYFEGRGTLQVVTGFIGSSEAGETTTLGRSGSDYTASIVGTALGADEIEIWTDVDGVMTADPREVPDAVSIESLTYEEAMELSHFGAKVIFPPTMQPAMSQQIPIRIRNTFNLKSPGTVIREKVEKKENLITGISSISGVALLRLQGSGMIGVTGTSGRLFRALSRQDVNVILISQASSEHSICFAASVEAAKLAKEAIEEEFALEMQAGLIDEVRIESDLSIVAVVGENMRHTPGISGKVFSALGNLGINVVAIAQGSSEQNISIVIDHRDEPRALRALHRAFFGIAQKTINLFIAGTGLIGAELLRLIGQARNGHLSVTVAGLVNSRKMLMDPEGIPTDSWKYRLSESGAAADIEAFIQAMSLNKSDQTIFVDCTASEEVSDRYREVLSLKVSIVTPNKIANTRGWEEFWQLRAGARQNGVKFLYETNVGGGLPVIGTLRSLVESGDRVLKIEGVLSGTLSYLFNSFSGDARFSEVVRQARDLGYTEPDPRDDLSGLDVARKLLILAREMGHGLELADIPIENLLPQGSDGAESVEEFLDYLADFDDDFEKKRVYAEESKKVLRYMASFEDGRADVGLREVENDHPFASLMGSENMIVFTTEHYRKHPLIVRGPGAGASVTAAGVLSDILRAAE